MLRLWKGYLIGEKKRLSFNLQREIKTLRIGDAFILLRGSRSHGWAATAGMIL